MIEIKDLLARFDSILLSEDRKIESVRDAVMQAVGLTIRKEDIKVKKGSIFLNIKPIYKSEIFLKREKIFSLLEKSFWKKPPESIQ